MKKIICGALCALFFIACGDSPEDLLKKEVEFQEKMKNLSGETKKKFASQSCKDGLMLACEFANDLYATQVLCDSDKYNGEKKVQACAYLFELYGLGNEKKGIKQDLDKSIECAKKSCDLGRENICKFLVEIYSGDPSNLKEEWRAAFEEYSKKHADPKEAEKYKAKITNTSGGFIVF